MSTFSLAWPAAEDKTMDKRGRYLYESDPIFHAWSDYVTHSLMNGVIDADRLVEATNVGLTNYCLRRKIRPITLEDGPTMLDVLSGLKEFLKGQGEER